MEQENLKSRSRPPWEEADGVGTAVLAEILSPELPWDSVAHRAGTRRSPWHRERDVGTLCSIPDSDPHRSLPQLLCGQELTPKAQRWAGVRGRTRGLCRCQTRGDHHSGAPCPALSLHPAPFDPKDDNCDPLELPLKPSNSSAASRWLCRVPSIPDGEIPTPKAAALRLCGTALCCRWPWGHRPRPLLRVETPGFMPPEGFLKDLGATRLSQEDAASMVPRHDKQQSPGGVSACLGFPFSLAGSRSGDYFWCCLTLERVTHGQGITPDPAPRCGQRK